MYRRHAFRAAEQYQFGYCCTGQVYRLFPAGDTGGYYCLHRQSSGKAVLLPGVSKDEAPQSALVSVCLSIFCTAHDGVFPFDRDADAAADQEYRYILAEF